MKAKIGIIVFALALSSAAYAQDAKPAAAPVVKVDAAPAPTAATTPPAATTPAATLAASAATTPAPTGETQKFWQGLLLTILEAVLAAAAPVLVVLLGWVLRKFKLKIEMDKLKWVVDNAVGFGEQKLRVALKDGKQPDYEGIKAQAVGLGKDLLLKKGLAKKWGGMLGDLVEAKLGISKLEGQEAPKTINDKPAPVES